MKDQQDVGFELASSGGKDLHRQFLLASYQGAVTLNRCNCDEERLYEEKQVERALT